MVIKKNVASSLRNVACMRQIKWCVQKEKTYNVLSYKSAFVKVFIIVTLFQGRAYGILSADWTMHIQYITTNLTG